MGILYLTSSILSLFFIAILSGKWNQGLSYRLLLAWFILLFISVLVFYLNYQELAPVWLIQILDNSAFLLGPLLYFYTASLTGLLQELKSRQLLHLLPFLSLYPLTLWISYGTWEYRDSFFTGLIILKFLLPVLYILRSIKLINLHRQRIQDIYSSTRQLELKWLSSILWGSLVLVLVGIVSLSLHYLTRIEIPQYGGYYLNAMYCLGIIVLGYFGFKQTSIFIPSHLLAKGDSRSSAQTVVQEEKYQKTSLGKDRVEKLYQELLSHMQSDCPYTDPGLSLFMLASQMETTENKISQVINSQSGLNFFEFVNRYRVQMVIDRMKKREHTRSTLLGMALDSGFNSKASFNRAFKKFSGITPSEYLKTLE